MDVNNYQTELELLELLIVAEGTQDQFSEKINWSRQYLSRIMKRAKGNNGLLDEKFKKRLISFNIDLYQFKSNPTNDRWGNKKINMAAEESGMYITKSTIEHILKYNAETINGLQFSIKQQQRLLSDQHLTIDKLVDKSPRKKNCLAVVWRNFLK